MSENVMRKPFVRKVVLSAGATGKELDKAKELLSIVSEKNPQIIKSGPRKRIPSFSVRPNMPLGTSVTIRGEDAIKLLNRLLGAIDNMLKKKQVADNHFSFGIREYIDIPGMEYSREIGIRGFNVTVDFERKGVRVKKKKIKKGKLPKRQTVSKEEIMTFMEENYKTQFV